MSRVGNCEIKIWRKVMKRSLRIEIEAAASPIGETVGRKPCGGPLTAKRCKVWSSRDPRRAGIAARSRHSWGPTRPGTSFEQQFLPCQEKRASRTRVMWRCQPIQLPPSKSPVPAAAALPKDRFRRTNAWPPAESAAPSTSPPRSESDWY